MTESGNEMATWPFVDCREVLFHKMALTTTIPQRSLISVHCTNCALCYRQNRIICINGSIGGSRAVPAPPMVRILSFNQQNVRNVTLGVCAPHEVGPSYGNWVGVGMRVVRRDGVGKGWAGVGG